MKKLFLLLLLILIGCTGNEEKWVGPSGDLVERIGKIYEKNYGITGQSVLNLEIYSGKYKQSKFDGSFVEIIERGTVVNGYKSGKFVHEYLDGTLKMEGVYNSRGEKHGYFTFYYKTGEIEMEGEYKYDAKDGMWGSFYRNGQKKGQLVYENGSLLFSIP